MTRCLIAPFALAFLTNCAPADRAAEWRLYVTNEQAGTLSVIDAPANTIAATIRLGKRPRGSMLSADGRFLYVALSGSPAAPPGTDETKLPPPDRSADGIGVVDTASLRLVRIVRGVTDPEQVAVSADGRTLFVVSEDAGALVILDAGGTVRARVTVGAEPEGVALSRDERTVFVGSEEAGTVSAVDIASQRVTASVATGKRPRTIAVSPDGRRLFVAAEGSPALYALEANPLHVAATASIANPGARPMGVVVSPDGRTVFASTGRGGRLLRFDAQTLAPTGDVMVGARPWGIATSPGGRVVYAANGPGNDVAAIDAASMRVLARIKVGAGPWGVAVGRSR